MQKYFIKICISNYYPYKELYIKFANIHELLKLLGKKFYNIKKPKNGKKM